MIPAVFDILCNYNFDLSTTLGFNESDKNILWSCYKELFGAEGNTRSIYNLHLNTQTDHIYEIIA